jgi:acid stress chaperone HdeA
VKRLVVLVPVLALLAGCAGFTNHGGQTSCGDYLNLSTEERHETIIQMLEEQGEENTTIRVTVASASVLVYCTTIANSYDTIVSVYNT